MYAALRMGMHGEKTTSFCKDCKCKPLQIYGKEFGLVGTDKGYHFHELPEKLLMTSHLDGHITTGLKPDMLSGIKTGNRMPHDPKMYMALRMETHAEKTTFSSKKD